PYQSPLWGRNASTLPPTSLGLVRTKLTHMTRFLRGVVSDLPWRADTVLLILDHWSRVSTESADQNGHRRIEPAPLGHLVQAARSRLAINRLFGCEKSQLTTQLSWNIRGVITSLLPALPHDYFLAPWTAAPKRITVGLRARFFATPAARTQ